jgi:hypothetical protein
MISFPVDTTYFKVMHLRTVDDGSFHQGPVGSTGLSPSAGTATDTKGRVVCDTATRTHSFYCAESQWFNYTVEAHGAGLILHVL